MSGKIHGFVISKNAFIECDTSWEITGSVETVKSAQCTPRHAPNRRRSALILLRELSKFDGKELECGLQDGSDVFVEGKDSVGSFALFAGNPEMCSDRGSVLVATLLKILES
jgi:hypothetical protein